MAEIGINSGLLVQFLQELADASEVTEELRNVLLTAVDLTSDKRTIERRIYASFPYEKLGVKKQDLDAVIARVCKYRRAVGRFYSMERVIGRAINEHIFNERAEAAIQPIRKVSEGTMEYSTIMPLVGLFVEAYNSSWGKPESSAKKIIAPMLSAMHKENFNRYERDDMKYENDLELVAEKDSVLRFDYQDNESAENLQKRILPEPLRDYDDLLAVRRKKDLDHMFNDFFVLNIFSRHRTRKSLFYARVYKWFARRRKHALLRRFNKRRRRRRMRR